VSLSLSTLNLTADEVFELHRRCEATVAAPSAYKRSEDDYYFGKSADGGVDLTGVDL
jgi:hypothetical protein